MNLHQIKNSVTKLAFIALTISSCTSYPEEIEEVIEMAGDNKKELTNVIKYYSKRSSDSLKLKAAIFLIKHMPQNAYLDGPRRKDFNSMFKEFTNDKRLGIAKKKELYKQYYKNHGNPPKVVKRDIDIITDDFIIDNIEYAFKAWNKIPKPLKSDFEEFCDYVLPYKAGNEILTNNSREILFKKHSWVHDSLNAGVPTMRVIHYLFDSISYQFDANVPEFPYSLTIEQMYHMNFGLCTHAVYYKVFLLRALGIPAATESLLQYGDHYHSGHDWLIAKTGSNKFTSLEPISKRRIYDTILKSDCIPQIIRDLPSGKIIVTNQYQDVFDLNIPVRNAASIGEYYLCLFNKNVNFNPVINGIGVKDNVLFQNIGRHCVYFPGYASNNRFTQIDYPFYLNKNNIIRFKPSGKTVEKAIITRKYPPFHFRKRNKMNWKRSLEECYVLASNDPEFKGAVKILDFDNFNSFQPQMYRVQRFGKYKYFKITHDSSQRRPFIAEIRFKNSASEDIKGDFSYVGGKADIVKISDQNSLTYVEIKNKCSVEFHTKDPVNVKYVQIQTRNDDNNIKVGDNYTLYYWDRNWISLGSQVAKDTMLVYNKVPFHALYWLQNNTGGREELPFTFNEYGHQVWLNDFRYFDEPTFPFNIKINDDDIEQLKID
ncbi:MAG: hypothetical protein MI922_09285 [Bacteroidales bacterium]|nr:hypothetical protein [Bacteroidales bacterium]